MSDERFNRRRFLQLAAGASAFTLAGCQGGLGSDETPLELTLETSGPYVANGQDAAEVRIEATEENEEGTEQPMEGLDVQARLFEGDDHTRPIQVQEQGDGVYTTTVTSEIAAPNLLEVTAAEIDGHERLEIPFEPGPPHHVWHVKERPPQLGDDLTAKFELMLKDELDNLIPPEEADFRLSSSNQAATFQQQRLPEKEAVRVQAGVEETPEPEDGIWTEFEVGIEEEASGDSAKTAVEFPMIETTRRTRRLDGEVVKSLTLHSLNFRPLESYSIVVPFDDDRMELVSVDDPDPQSEFPEPTVERIDEGVRIQAEGRSAKPTTGLARLNFRHLTDVGMIELPIRIEPIKFIDIPPWEFILPIDWKLVLAQTVCLKIWRVESIDSADVDDDLASTRQVFDDAEDNCCPIISFDVDREEISTSDWESIDDGDGDLDIGRGTNTRQENGQTIEVPNRSSEESSLFEDYHEDDCINAYYVPSLPGGTIGISYPELTDDTDTWSWDTDGEQNGDVIAVGGDGAGNEKTLPHELGHLMGELKHAPSSAPSSNIMYQTWQDRVPGTFNEDQCDKLWELQV